MPKIQVRKENNRVINGYRDFIHQNEAQEALTEKILNDNEDSFFSGLLAIPTGGGKTFIAVEWLLKNWIDQGGKVLWIAHRHELLKQAFQTFERNTCDNLLGNFSAISDYVQYRIISGQAGHDSAADIHEDDDVLIAGKDSLRSEAGKESLSSWINANNLQKEGLFLVIDEAHHAPAKTYRDLIDDLRDKIREKLKILGLTATPFRTDQKSLEKVFPNKIIYATHLRTLIRREILSKPVFEEVKTEWQAVKNLNLKNYDLDRIRRFDLPGGLKTQIAKDTARNRQIVQHYLENKERYGQTLVFALNRYHAELLNDMFNESGIEADLVISGQKDNEARINRFRNGEIEVLINVQIVTEGTDLPQVQTAFLTRPTISKILMTQMIGRALRGKASGGTEQAYIVSFIDNWQDKIVWVTPKEVFDEEFDEELEGTELKDAKKREKRMIRRISIEKMAEFARMLDRAIDTSTLELLGFLERIPVGFYEFTLFEIREEDNESIERSCEVLVYSHLEKQYARFVDDLPDIFEENRGRLDEIKVHLLSGQVISKYFQYVRYQLAFREEDVEDILRYYFKEQVKPRFVRFDEREKYDIDKIAREIHESDCRISEKTDVVNNLWEQDETLWKALFAHKKSCFLNEIDLALRKITHEVELLREAAESGNAEAQLRLGYTYLRGDCGMASDSKEAKKWFEKAANQGDAEAQYQFGEGFRVRDWIVAEDEYVTGDRFSFLEPGRKALEEAEKWFEKAANQGNAHAQYKLALRKVSIVKEEAIEWFGKAADQGDEKAQFELGRIYKEEGEYNEAKKWFLKAAEEEEKAFSFENKTSAKSKYELGRIYKEEGEYNEAKKWFLKAAEAKPFFLKSISVKSKYELGRIYKEEEEYNEAKKWFLKAAKKKGSTSEGDAAKSEYELGRIYKEEGDYNEAEKWFLKASKTSPFTPEDISTQSKYELGEIYEEQVLEAYGKVKERADSLNVEIYELQQELGTPMDQLKKFILKSCHQDRAVLSFGDWSLSSEESRTGAIYLVGNPHLLVRFRG